MKKHSYFYFIVVAIFLILISPKQWADGMFFDGMLYASIARNMAIDLGYIWKPYANAIWSEFFEHPPLAFWLQSFLFRLVGDSIYVERIYSFFTFVLTGGIILLIWRRITGNIQYGWLPLLLWITVPTVSWACANNMLENTLMMFTSLSIYFYLRKEDNFYFLILSGVSIFLAFLSKGVFAFFVLSVPFWMWAFAIEPKLGKTILYGLVLLTFVILPALLIAFYEDDFVLYLKAYWLRQVVGSVQNIQTVDSRFSILNKMINDLLPSLGIVLLLLFVSFKKKIMGDKPAHPYRSWSWVFLCIGLSGVLPIMVSLKQSSFYILATFPVFALAFALYVLPIVELLVERIKDKGWVLLSRIGFALLVVSIIASAAQAGRIGRDEVEMKDMYTTLTIIPRDSVISISKNMGEEWHAYARYYRYGQVTATPDENKLHYYFLARKDSPTIPSGYVLIPLKTLAYDLYKRVE